MLLYKENIFVEKTENIQIIYFIILQKCHGKVDINTTSNTLPVTSCRLHTILTLNFMQNVSQWTPYKATEHYENISKQSINDRKALVLHV